MPIKVRAGRQKWGGGKDPEDGPNGLIMHNRTYRPDST